MADDVVNEQIEYYAARAPEYNDWWERRGEFDAGPEFARAWQTDIEALEEWLAGCHVHGRVLEIAAGTGNWTGELTRYADTITAVDSSRETLDINQRLNGDENVEFIVADVFAWDPPQQYDSVFFSFWLSHIPEGHWAGFWDLVSKALVPGGRVMFIDNAHPAHSAENGPGDRSITDPHHDMTPSDRPDWLQQREVRNGATYSVVKRYWWPHELAELIAAEGFAADVEHTGFAFIRGTAHQ